MGFEHWEVGFRKKLGWEMGLVPPLQDPLIYLVDRVIRSLNNRGLFNISFKAATK